ncbi:hypothetical protein PROFUN_10256 [Planoprotostelium fungivorum]|nr:hypothetical protein PROFUN_10256 [Planoprotostelium fungivorum]
MGIHGLQKLINDHAPGAITETEMKNLFNRKIAIDATMSLYQFLIAVRIGGEGQPAAANLTDESGETTSHLQGLFHRTIRMINNGVKPCYVFDGKPPDLKAEELAKRAAKREEAEKNGKEATEAGDTETIAKFAKRTVKVTRKHTEEAKRLLTLMGVPVVDSPTEAEAQCARMAKEGLVYGAGSEDMDSLTFGASVLIRHLTFSEARKMPIKEINLSVVLEQLGLDMNQFTDMCILLGCDYADSIKGIGPVRAFDLIKKHGSLEEIIKNLDSTKYPIPESFDYVRVRQLFKEPDTLPASQIDLKWKDPDEEGLIEFLVKEKGFAEDRVKSGIEKLKKSRGTSVQNRLDSYFGAPVKRKLEEPKKEKGKGAKKAKTGGKAAASPVKKGAGKKK